MKKLSVCLVNLLFLVGVSGIFYAFYYSGLDIAFAEVGNKAISSRWSTEEDITYKAWSKEWFECPSNLDANDYVNGLTMMNYGYFGSYLKWYPKVKLHHALNNGAITPASDFEANFGFTNLDISTAGEYTTTNNQLSDTYASHLDVNFHIERAFFDSTKPAPNTNPATMLLLGTGLIGIAGFGRKLFNYAETVPNPKSTRMLLLGNGLISIAGFGRKKN
jgi:hypothetical protein